MGIPATTARTTPAGSHLKNGHPTLIAFAADPDVSFWEKTVQPPGLDGGDPIDQTTMHNDTYRTMAPRSLITMTEFQVVAAYDPAVIDQILALINVEGAITVHHPDGSTEDFFGFLRQFERSEHTEGEQPEATITIVPTNVDPSDDSEAAVNYTAPAGS